MKLLSRLPLLALLAAPAAAAQEASRDLLFDDVVVRVAPGASFEPASPAAASGEILRLGRLTLGAAEVSTLRAVSLGAGGRTVLIEPGIVRLSVADDGLRVCTVEGSASVEPQTVVAEGSCIFFGVYGEPAPFDSVTDAIVVPPASPSAPPADVPDDLEAAAERYGASGAAGAGEGGGESSESGGAAACLDSGGTGAEAAGPDSGELPETEIDRSHHRLDVTVTLEGY